MNHKIWLMGIACIIVFFITDSLVIARSSNYACAIGSLKAIQAAETIWKQTSMSGTGKTDYWTYDVSAMYRMLKAGSACSVINIDLAKSDAGWHKDGTFGAGITQDWNAISATIGPKAGYYCQAMLLDEDGKPYNQNELNGIKVANDYKYAFVAYPAVYESSGERTFIINQDGEIYSTDCGSEESKIVLHWPGKDPTKTLSPGGIYWDKSGSGTWHTISRKTNSPFTFWGVLVLIIMIISTGYVLFKKDNKNQAQINAGK